MDRLSSPSKVEYDSTASPGPKVLRIAEHASEPRDARDDSASLTLLGGWALWRGGRQVKMALSAQRLCVLLALKGGQRRSYLAGMLWPEVRDEQALTRLRGTLCHMRRQYEELVETDGQTVALHQAVRVDVVELVTAARDVIESRIRPEQLDAMYERLIDPPELLLGWYDDWVLQERDRINQLRVRALEALVDQLLEAGRRGAAFEAATAAIRLDPLRESTHRALMRVHLAEGNPALAARQVKHYREILRTELGTEEPTREMLELANGQDAVIGDALGRSDLMLRGA